LLLVLRTQRGTRWRLESKWITRVKINWVIVVVHVVVAASIASVAMASGGRPHFVFELILSSNDKPASENFTRGQGPGLFTFPQFFSSIRGSALDEFFLEFFIEQNKQYKKKKNTPWIFGARALGSVL
jgi:hypothetical protein